MAARAVIVGGGVGALEAAHLLKGKLDVTLITGSDHYVSGPSRPLILSGEQSLDRIVRGYHRVEREVTVIRERVQSVDLENGKVKTKGKEVDFDYLVLSTGLRYDYSKIRSEKVYNVYDLGRLYDLKDVLWNMREGSIVVSAPKQPYRCAPAPAETVLTIDMVLRHRGVRDNIDITFVDGNPKVQPPVIHDVITGIFEDRNIGYILENEVVEVTEEGVVLSSGESLRADVKVVLPPNIGYSPLGEGFIEVRSPNDLRLKQYDNVFAVGDVAKLPYPKNSEVASISARIAATQILETEGLGEHVKEPYRFVGWAYAGNGEGKLETESIKFELAFTGEGPRGSRDPEPKQEYTMMKDTWEQALLKKLFGY